MSNWTERVLRMASGVIRVAHKWDGSWLLSLLVIAAVTSHPLQAQNASPETQHDVVPPSWITYDGHSGVGSESDDSWAAYIFPSLHGSGSADAITFSLLNFFLPSNRFRGPTRSFHWSVNSGKGEDIELVVSRRGKEAVVNISINALSMTKIRELDWVQFQHLQRAFQHWLCKHSGSWLFGDCQSRFTNLQDDLLKIWRKDRKSVV